MDYLIYHPSQKEEITQLFLNTFTDSEGEKEGKLVSTLVVELLNSTNEQERFVLIASEQERVVGAIIFSRLTFENDINAFILSPVAVHTDHQRKGIGQSLIRFGLQYLKEQNVELVLTYGDPDFYSKVGFTPITEQQIKAPFPLSYPHGWLAQSLTGADIPIIQGDSRCVAGLNKPELW